MGADFPVLESRATNVKFAVKASESEGSEASANEVYTNQSSGMWRK